MVADERSESPFALRLRCLCQDMLLPMRAHALRVLNRCLGKREMVPLVRLRVAFPVRFFWKFLGSFSVDEIRCRRWPVEVSPRQVCPVSRPLKSFKNVYKWREKKRKAKKKRMQSHHILYIYIDHFRY